MTHNSAREVALSNLDRVLWPSTGFTKGDLVDYYRRVAAVMVPHIARRPVTLGRFPKGVAGQGFPQTEARGAPEWLATYEGVLRDGTRRRFCVLDDEPSLVWAANQNTIEIHPYSWRAEQPERTDFLVFDVDPGPGRDLTDCCRVAVLVREALDEHGLQAFPKTSGSSGLHVYVPFDAPHDEARAFARKTAHEIAGERPDELVANPRRPRSDPRVLIDWGVNGRGRSTVAAYSLRAMPMPQVSTPVTWDEVEAAEPDKLRFGPEEVLQRIERHGDLFAPVIPR